MSDYLIELTEVLCRHMPNKDFDYWMDLMVNSHDSNKIISMAERFRMEDKNRDKL